MSVLQCLEPQNLAFSTSFTQEQVKLRSWNQHIVRVLEIDAEDADAEAVDAEENSEE